MWGTAVGVDVRDDIDPHALDAVFSWFQMVDILFSTWREDSEVSRLGRGELPPEQTSPAVRDVLRRCEDMRVRTNGAFDISFAADTRVLPRPGFGAIDPSGYVKGWALEAAARQLRCAGAANFTLNAGGDVIAAGHPAAGEKWRVGIQHPWEWDRVAAVVAVVDRAIATSGTYERGDHVIDPRTGLPARDLVSVTVVGGDLGEVDALATAGMAMGRSGMAWLASVPGVEAFGITAGGDVLVTEGFGQYR